MVKKKMGYFEDIEILDTRRRKQHERLRQVQSDKDLFIASAIGKVVELVREFADKAPVIVPHKFIVTPTHKRKTGFFDTGHTYRLVIEMPDVMHVDFGINLSKYTAEAHHWNEVYLDKAGRYHACERLLVPYGEGSQMSYCVYKGFLYERNLAKALFEAYLENQIVTEVLSENRWDVIDSFIDYLIDQLDDYLMDEK